jgi:hypothetical protein
MPKQIATTTTEGHAKDGQMRLKRTVNITGIKKKKAGSGQRPSGMEEDFIGS